MKSILLSIKPKWVAKIFNGEKTIEVRKRFPKDYKGWVYIYCTKDIKEELSYVPATDKFYSYPKKLFITKQLKKMGLTFNGKVVARFYCDKVEEIYTYYDDDARECINYTNDLSDKGLLEKSCLTNEELNHYFEDKEEDVTGYAIHISQLEIFDKPIELSEFYKASCKGCFAKNTNYCDEKYCRITKAPQSYMFIEVEE